MNAKSVKTAPVTDIGGKREELARKRVEGLKTHPAIPKETIPYETILNCRNQIEYAMADCWGEYAMDIHSTEGWSVFFRYVDICDEEDLDQEPVEMAFKVQPAETHDEMVAVWDMHCLSESKEQFIEIYSMWYDKYKVPHMESSRKGGGDDAVANS